MCHFLFEVVEYSGVHASESVDFHYYGGPLINSGFDLVLTCLADTLSLLYGLWQ